MTAPVSLAEIKAEIVAAGCGCPCKTCKAMRRFAPVVELAEAYLEWRDFDKRPKGMGFGGEELQQAHERLALAAKWVRP